MNKVLVVVVALIIVACGGVAMPPQASQTVTIWKTLTSRTTYTSTYTTFSVSRLKTTSSVTAYYTYERNLTSTFEDYEVDMKKEDAAHYAVSALIFHVAIPAGTPRGTRGGLVATFHYRSRENMTLEQIGMDTWMDMRTSSKFIFSYYSMDKIEVYEGTGTWSVMNSYLRENVTKIDLVYITSGEPLPDIVSVDVGQVFADAVTETSTFVRPTTFWTSTILAKTTARTYTTTKIFLTFEMTAVSPTKPTYTATETTVTRPSITETRSATTTASPSLPFPGIDPLGLQLIGFMVLLVLAVVVVVVVVRRVRKPKPPYALGPAPPPI